jgi:hypothetical protein
LLLRICRQSKSGVQRKKAHLLGNSIIAEVGTGPNFTDSVQQIRWPKQQEAQSLHFVFGFGKISNEVLFVAWNSTENSRGFLTPGKTAKRMINGAVTGHYSTHDVAQNETIERLAAIA